MRQILDYVPGRGQTTEADADRTPDPQFDHRLVREMLRQLRVQGVVDGQVVVRQQVGVMHGHATATLIVECDPQPHQFAQPLGQHRLLLDRIARQTSPETC